MLISLACGLHAIATRVLNVNQQESRNGLASAEMVVFLLCMWRSAPGSAKVRMTLMVQAFRDGVHSSSSRLLLLCLDEYGASVNVPERPCCFFAS